MVLGGEGGSYERGTPVAGILCSQLTVCLCSEFPVYSLHILTIDPPCTSSLHILTTYPVFAAHYIPRRYIQSLHSSVKAESKPFTAIVCPPGAAAASGPAPAADASAVAAPQVLSNPVPIVVHILPPMRLPSRRRRC